MEIPDPQYPDDGSAYGEDPGIDIRGPVVDRLRQTVRHLSGNASTTPVTDFEHPDFKGEVRLSDIELAEGEEQGTLFAKVYDKAIDHRKVVIFAGAVTVAAGLAVIARARVKSHKKP
jgi:hypothetical protein